MSPEGDGTGVEKAAEKTFKKISKKVLTDGPIKVNITKHASERDGRPETAVEGIEREPRKKLEKSLKKLLTGQRQDGNILNCAHR